MKKYLVDLTGDERDTSQALMWRGKTQSRKVTRAPILLHTNRGASDSEIIIALGVGSLRSNVRAAVSRRA